MGAYWTILTSLIATAALAVPALAAEDDWPVIKGTRVDEQPPWGAFALYSPDGDSTGVSLYARPSPNGLVLAARRVQTPNGQASRIDWASASTCPQLVAAATAMEDLPMPRIEAPAVGREPRSSPVVMDGASYFVWASDARFSGGANSAGVELRALEGSPVAEWVSNSLKAMSGCWGPSLP